MTTIEIINECTLKVNFGAARPLESSEKISQLRALLQSKSEAILDFIPAYTSLTIIIDTTKASPQSFKSQLIDTLHSIKNHANPRQGKLHSLPCYYGPEFAWDLARLAKDKDLKIEDVIKLHCENIYRVYAIGFSPGFPYLGFVNDKIACPRLKEPRTSIPNGAVGIAENQTGIYPKASPGGWNIIGCCPQTLFDVEADTSSLCTLKVGDSVQFEAISKIQFIELGGDTSYFKYDDNLKNNNHEKRTQRL